jgi:hypothetical protein
MTTGVSNKEVWYIIHTNLIFWLCHVYDRERLMLKLFVRVHFSRSRLFLPSESGQSGKPKMHPLDIYVLLNIGDRLFLGIRSTKVSSGCIFFPLRPRLQAKIARSREMRININLTI